MHETNRVDRSSRDGEFAPARSDADGDIALADNEGVARGTDRSEAPQARSIPGPERPQAPPEAAAASEPQSRSARRRLLRGVLFALLLSH